MDPSTLITELLLSQSLPSVADAIARLQELSSSPTALHIDASGSCAKFRAEPLDYILPAPGTYFPDPGPFKTGPGRV